MFPKWLYDMQIEAPDLFMCLNSHWDRVFKNIFTWAPTSAKPKVGTGKCSGKSSQPTWHGPHHPSGALKYLLNMLLGAQKNCPSIVLFQTASDWWVSLSFSHGEYFINVSHSAKFFFKFENKICKQKFGHGIYNLAYLSFLRGRSDWVDLTLMVLTLLTSDMSLVSETSLATSSDMSGLNSAIMPPRQIHRSI